MSLPEYELVRSGRKTLAVEITGDCRVVVRAPARLSRERIERFVAEHEAWIEKHLEVQRRRKENHPLPTEAEREAYIKKARDILPGKVERFGRIMGVSPTGITITGAGKRFGSCSAKNSLCFSCFLMNCPEEAVELVVVHELCHIREKNHGPGFYALLERYLPDWRERKKLLSMN